MNSIYRKSNVVKTYSLIIIEIICLIISYLLAIVVKYGSLDTSGNRDMYFTCLMFMIAVIVLYTVATDWNRDFFIRGYFKEAIIILRCVIIVTLMGGAFVFMLHIADNFSRKVYLLTPAFQFVFTYGGHILFKEYMLKCYKKSVNSDKLMIITDKSQAEMVVNKILNEKIWNCELTCIAITDEDMVGKEIQGIPVVASGKDVIDVATGLILDRVFISLPRAEIGDIKDMIMEFEAMGILCHYNIEIPELSVDGKEAGTFAGYSVISFSLQNMDYRRLMIKRVFDIIGSLVGILITLIVFPFVALAIVIESPGPVIFKQERIGKNGRRFMMYKFRSMYKDAEKRLNDVMDKNEVKGLMFKIEDDPRITKVGRFIRKTSIDELPQFFNVLKGDMSLVGTRPPTVNEFEQYNSHYRRRLCITPGITGMWQANGRSDISDFDQVVKLDLEYIDQWSLRLDAKLLLLTVLAVLFRRGSK